MGGVRVERMQYQKMGGEETSSSISSKSFRSSVSSLFACPPPRDCKPTSGERGLQVPGPNPVKQSKQRDELMKPTIQVDIQYPFPIQLIQAIQVLQVTQVIQVIHFTLPSNIRVIQFIHIIQVIQVIQATWVIVGTRSTLSYSSHWWSESSSMTFGIYYPIKSDHFPS